jgi:hypothetical protein
MQLKNYNIEYVSKNIKLIKFNGYKNERDRYK